ncbi:RluA family pseudouridine synthase [Ottowia beijingensis]|uniref:Dual-specificity RNA pseudouridine synthase RluA n=1 Tax=Ottowia beijingensis TaxID=1207057 RepID=A0A853IRG0_9BURK|nr:RluA family pseudouridine synthase [Ottowia beijingensis]NZA02812.1 RluA family pseudouridine synthase [Ottowia beijingensis]
MDDVEVLHEDAHLLALVKPAGLLSVPGRGPQNADCLSTRAQRRWPGALIVHRLDQATSGLLLMARSAAVQRALSSAFAERRVHKRYEALVHGRPSAATDADGWAEIDLPLIVDWPNRPRSKVDHASGKPSRTRWRLLAHNAATDTARLALEPVTGRSHQLRVHLLALGHPIVGDALYGAPDTAPRLMLHACALRFEHPVSGHTLDLRSDVPF